MSIRTKTEAKRKERRWWPTVKTSQIRGQLHESQPHVIRPDSLAEFGLLLELLLSVGAI
jgi:hypothetical protein